MLVQVVELRRVTGSLRSRATFFVVSAGLLGLFSLFWLVIAVAMCISPRGDNDVFAATVCGLTAGVLPALATFFLARASRRRLRKAALLEKLSWAAQEDADPIRVAAAIDRPVGETELLLREAWAAGILVQPAPLPPPSAPEPSAPTPVPPAPDSGPLLGRVLNGTYRVERHLGDGAMGSVWVARHLRTERLVAVKTLHPDAQLSESAVRRFRQEATTASAIGHEGIVSVLDFDITWDGLCYLVMELCEGETLEQRLAATGPLPFAIARRIALQVGAALHAAHTVGVLHRDLKPANVFLRIPRLGAEQARERAVLLDFGLAKPLGADTRITASGAAIGTPAYMSPEQARGADLDARSDVYSLGALLYETVTGEPPFLAPSVPALFAKLLTESPRIGALPPGCPPGLPAVLARVLAKDPNDRYADVPAFLSALEALGANDIWYPPANGMDTSASGSGDRRVWQQLGG